MLAAVPFALASERSAYTQAGGYHGTRERVDGVARLEPDALVLQFRRSERVQRMSGMGFDESTHEGPVEEVRIALPAIRGVRVERRLWRTRLRIAAADLRPFDGAPGWSGTELVLGIARGDRLAAEELAGQAEMLLAERLLAAGDPLLPPA